MSRLRPIIALATAGVAALTLAACGDDGTTTVINNTTTTTVAAQTDATSSTSSTPTTDDSSTTDGGTSATSLKTFQSPSGNIGCIMSAKSLRCDIREKDWSADRPAGCPSEIEYGQGLTLSASGPAEVVCAGDTALDPSAPTLEYGASSTAGPLTCTSNEAAMVCSNQSGGGFSLARESYSLN